jgi:hypothetical protein
VGGRPITAQYVLQRTVVTATTAHCAFCFHVTDYGPGGDGVRLTIERDDGTTVMQQLYAHVFCLSGRLHPRNPLYIDIFGEDWASVDGMGPRTIYIELVDEGVDVWAPVQAVPMGTGYRLPKVAPDGQTWRFPPGSLVRCVLRDLGDGLVLVALEAMV